ncbi:MAG: hypothetical protein KBF57_06320 [Saprospiraceae bacterium]|jgi:hypothetical protein|nr:hypothetical protein [Saprospiraceae bacterium]
MKYFFLVLAFVSFTVLSISAQKQYSCKSGQNVVVDGASNFLSSNIQELMDEHSAWAPDSLALYQSLLEKEQRNRLELAKLERLLAILDYDLQRASKEDKNTFKAKQQTAKKDISRCEKEYEQLSGLIQKLVKRQDKAAKEPKVAERPADQVVAEIGSEEVVTAQPITEDPPKAEEVKSEKIVINKIDEANKKESSCEVVFKGKDETSKKKRITLAQQRLLTYTPEKMKNYFKLKDFLTISMAAEKHGGKYNFEIEARFASKDVMRSYGVILKTDFLRMQFVNGKRVFLKVLDVTEPYLDRQGGETIYKVKCTLNNDQDISVLETQYLDSFGIMWSTGFEDYMVYDVDFILRQLKCLRNDR